jgi:glycosyltransferase involved in cell wall biosynthesis
MRRILHVLSQRPSLTGSGITLEALVRHAGAAGWDQCTVIGAPHDEAEPEVGGLPEERIRPLRFGSGELDFSVPGMSDVMPYPSTRFSSMTERQIAAYRRAWERHLREAVSSFRPDLVHSHHIWILSSLLKDIDPGLPVVTQCHATGFRQMKLCPHLAEVVISGCARNDRFLVLHGGHAGELERTLEVPAGRIRTVGAGYREDLFHARGAAAERGGQILYTGKYSAAKGLPWLLEAVDRLSGSVPGLELHVAGSGAGEEAETLRARMAAMSPRVVLHGQIGQAALADLMRRCAVCVLPSFYEGVPLVLVEALACGCRIVATDLPGIRSELAPALGKALTMVPLPPLRSVDVPDPAGLPAFVDGLESALRSALEQPSPADPGALEPFRWSAVFRRVEEVWRELLTPVPT